MAMIVMIHVLGQGGVLRTVENFSGKYYAVWLMNSIVYCAVNCFALLSGFVGYQGSFKISRWIQLWFQVVFYGVTALIVFCILSVDNLSVDLLKKAIMPFTQSEYWYITAYAGMFFLIPVMNAALRSMRGKQLLGCLLAVFALYTFLPTVFNQDPFRLHYGYSTLWLCLMYLTGGYLGKYNLPERIGSKRGFFLYLTGVGLSFAGKTMSELFTYRLLGEIKYGYVFVSYTSPLMVLAAIGLLCFVANLKLKNQFGNKVICTMATATLGVYIIHVQPYVFCQIVLDCTIHLAYEPLWKMILLCLLYMFVIYLACTILDLIRIQIFRLLHIPQLSAFLEKWIRNLFDKVCTRFGIDSEK